MGAVWEALRLAGGAGGSRLKARRAGSGGGSEGAGGGHWGVGENAEKVPVAEEGLVVFYGAKAVAPPNAVGPPRGAGHPGGLSPPRP